MKKLTAEQIQTNWNTLIEIIDSYISDDRRDNLLKFYDDFKERMSAYYSECEALSLQLVDILCKNLGAEPSTLLKIQSDFVDNSSYLRLNYMPPCPFPAKIARPGSNKSPCIPPDRFRHAHTNPSISGKPLSCDVPPLFECNRRGERSSS